jgi:hypothetical protein
MARVLDAIGARLDEASSSSPSASSVSGSTPPENLKGKGSLRDTLSDGRSRPNRHPESSTDAPDGTVERIGLRRSGARQGPRRKSRARSGSAAFSDMSRGAWKRVAPHITMKDRKASELQGFRLSGLRLIPGPCVETTPKRAGGAWGKPARGV